MPSKQAWNFRERVVRLALDAGTRLPASAKRCSENTNFQLNRIETGGREWRFTGEPVPAYLIEGLLAFG